MTPEVKGTVMYEHLLYKGNPKNRPLPKVLSIKDISKILLSIQNSNAYTKNKNLKDWSNFLKIRDITCIAVCYICALRPLEVCMLRFEDFDLKHSLLKVRGCSNKLKKDRIIPIPKVLYQYLKVYLKFPRERFWKGSPYLFVSMERPHLSSKRIEVILRERALKPLGLWRSGEVSTYTLRHSRASHILEKQVKENKVPDLYAISNLLGHSDIRSTTVYLHTDKNYMEYLRKQIEI